MRAPNAPRRRGRLAALCGLALALGACTNGAASPADHAAVPSGSVDLLPSSSPAPTSLQLRVAPAGFRLAAPVQRAVSVTDGDVVYIAGGLTATGSSASGVFAMNPVSGALTSVGSLPAAVHDAAGAMLGGRLLVFGGGSSSGTELVQAFDPTTGTSRVVGHLPVALSDLATATVGSTVYLIGGYDGRAPRPEIYATSDGRRFQVVGRLPVGLRYPAVAVSGSTVLVAGGQDAHGPTSRVYAFDTATGRVTTFARLLAPVTGAAAFVQDGCLFVLGGLDAAGDALDRTAEVDLSTGAVRTEPPLRRPLADTAVATVGDRTLLIGGWDGSTVDSVLAPTLQPASTARPGPTSASTGRSSTAAANPTSARPFAGLLLIADRGNDRLLVVNPRGQVVWRYPSPNLPAPPFRFYFPDDAFWVHGGNAILVNEEENDALAEIAYPSGRTIWTYGHPKAPGSSPGFVHQPDDLYPYPGGGAVVADAMNCRILFFHPNGMPSHQIGTTGDCSPGLPTTIGYPNAATPLPDGNLLVTELHGGIVAKVRPDGTPLWQVRVPGLAVPSDPQPLPDGSFVAVDYASPGAVVRFTRTGRVLWTYRPTSGPGMLDHPSLAAPLPNGLIAVTDDYRDRVVLIDPKTDRIMWQYGRTDRSGRTRGLLRTPDGLDLLLPGSQIPLHPDFPSPRVHPGRP